MSLFDAQVLAEKASAVERHLARVKQRLPQRAEDLQPATDAADAVTLHLWQAIQLVIDLAVSACMRLHLGAPNGYADAFVRLAQAGHLDISLSSRLVQASGLRNRIAHAYESLDLSRVHAAATRGPDDLRAFLAAMRDAEPGTKQAP